MILTYLLLSMCLCLGSEFMLVFIFTVTSTKTIQNFTSSLTYGFIINFGLWLHSEFNYHFERCIKCHYILCTYLSFMEIWFTYFLLQIWIWILLIIVNIWRMWLSLISAGNSQKHGFSLAKVFDCRGRESGT